MVKSLTKEQQQLIQQVQYNCDISDANHAGSYTLCIYLLKMREYYRWLNSLEFSNELESDKMGAWLREREETWEQVIDNTFQDIQLGQHKFDVFDTENINSNIASQNLFYHAGIGQKAAHHFFVADLLESYIDKPSNTKITITGSEYARDLTSPPAVSNQNEIIIRQESLKRLCWERYQEWHWNQYDNPMGTALAYYPFNESVSDALHAMVMVEQNTLIQHELGEMSISKLLGTDWSEMMLKILGTKAELLARSVRDHLADCIKTLPFLIEQNSPASIHFYFANLTHMRKQLFPSAMQAYQIWNKSGTLESLSDIVDQAAPHWENTVNAILQTDRNNDQELAVELTDLIEQAAF